MSSTTVLIRRSDRVLSRNVGGEVFLAAPERDGFDRLSETAGVVWRLLDVPRSEAELVGMLAGDYGVPLEAIAADVEALLDDLRRRGWIEEVGGP